MRSGEYDLGVAFDGDGDRMLAVDETGEALDGDQILAVLALALGVDTVAVTTMTNLGFHRLMAERGVRVLTTDVGDRHVLAAMRAEGAVLGGEQSGHIISLDGHVTGDGLAAALLLCRALDGGSLAAAAAVLELLPQAKENIRVDAAGRLAGASRARSSELESELAGRGRILVRAVRARSPSSACSSSPKARRRQQPSVVESPISSGRSPTSSLSADVTETSEDAAESTPTPPVGGGRRRRIANVRDHRIRRTS